MLEAVRSAILATLGQLGFLFEFRQQRMPSSVVLSVLGRNPDITALLESNRIRRILCCYRASSVPVHFDFVLRRADKLHFGSLQLMSIYMYEKQQQKQQQDVDPFNPLRPIDVMISTAIKHPVPDRVKP